MIRCRLYRRILFVLFRVNMDVKCVIALNIFLLGTQGAVLPIKDDLPSEPPHLLQYHPNMTSIWMVDNFGKLREVYLTSRPQQDLKPIVSAEDKVFFFLYTREYPHAYELPRNDISRLKSSTFDASRPTKVVTHGFWSDYKSDAVQLVKEAYLNAYNVNVLGVDWSDLAAGPWYIEAADNSVPVGKQVGHMIDYLVTSAGATIEDFHLLGHSLGAHVMSFASNSVKSGRIKRITGLDPALPLFSRKPPDQRLDPTDANLVDCIHTCGGYLGFYDNICTHDFYPNGGKASQPGCNFDILGSCSHERSYRYFSVSLFDNFTARACSSFDHLEQGYCYGSLGLMGDSAVTSKPGLYYLETNSDYPYAKY